MWTRRLGIAALLGYTLLVTILRAFHATPNFFATAHWLLDYRFGFIKRGLAGEVLSLVTGLTGTPVTARLISAVAVTLLAVHCFVMVGLALRVVRNARWSTEAVLVALVFLSSPYFVMSAYLVGYYDNLVVMLGVGSVVLLLNGRPWWGAVLQLAALLTHESAVLIVLPLFGLAWLLNNGRLRQANAPVMDAWPLLLPVAVFLLLAVGQEYFVSKEFVAGQRAHLSTFPFIDDNSLRVPEMLAPSFRDNLAQQSGRFLHRISLMTMHAMILPSTSVVLFFVVATGRIRAISLECLVLLGVCFVPQFIHLLAVDTMRIWTYTIVCSYLALWIYSEMFASHEVPAAIVIICLAVLTINAGTSASLLSEQVDEQFTTARARLLMYGPVVVGALWLLVLDERSRTAGGPFTA